MTVRWLPPLEPPAGELPSGVEESHFMRLMTRSAAFETDAWGVDEASEVRGLFDRLADEWDTRDKPERFVPIVDALDRGGPFGAGLTVELGSGTGIATRVLAPRFSELVAFDLSMQMLRRAPQTAPRVCADGSCLPLRDGSVATLVLINMLLFPAEADRVLVHDGAIVWVNTSGPRTPIYLSAEDVDAALPGAWDVVASEAGPGTWCVARRAE